MSEPQTKPDGAQPFAQADGSAAATFWADGWCRKYQEVCWMPKGRDRECVKAAIRFAKAFKRELTKGKVRHD